MAQLSRGAAWLALVAALASSIHVASAQRRATTAVAIGSADAPESLRGALHSALSAALESDEGVRVTAERNARFLLRAAITRLDVREEGLRSRIECEVSLIVEERRGGAVRMMLSGRATAAGPEAAGLRDDVLRAAVRGAVRPLSQSLLQQR